jgi:hypothetical protein
MNVIGGLFGIIIMITIPCLMVIKGRNLAKLIFGENYKNNL